MGLSKDDVPPQVEETIMHVQGEQQGQVWLNTALGKLNELEDDWEFRPVEVIDAGEESLLVKVEETAAEESAVIKIPVDAQAGCDEIAALKIWEDCNVPEVRYEDANTGMFMMDYVPPTEKNVTPFQAFVLADVLHTPAQNFDYRFPSLEDNLYRRITRAYRRAGKGSADLDLAVKTVETLLRTQDHEELLHGDYRNDNIIYSEDGPVIIDPMPCMGDSLFDIALWLADNNDYDDIAVVLELTAGFGERLVPWIWSLTVLDQWERDTFVVEGLKPSVSRWLQAASR